MLKVSYSRNGDPDEVIEVVQAPPPVPAPHEVLVELEAAPIHIADLKAIRGQLAFRLGGGVPGFEGVGRITQLGSAVTDWSVGDRAVLPLRYGAWQSLTTADPAGLWRAPDGVAAEQLALVRINLSTAYLLLKAFAQLSPGDWVVQNAANSNVAGYVAQLARDMGLNLIDVVRRPELVPALQASGRAHVLVDGPSLAGDIAGLASGPVSIAFDAVGGPATARLAATVADGGGVVCYGFLSEAAYQVEYHDLMFRDVRPVGFLTDRAFDSLSAGGQAEMSEVLQAMLAAGGLDAQIAAVYPFEAVHEALRHAARTGAARQGKIILKPTLG